MCQKSIRITEVIFFGGLASPRSITGRSSSRLSPRMPGADIPVSWCSVTSCMKSCLIHLVELLAYFPVNPNEHRHLTDRNSTRPISVKRPEMGKAGC